MAHYKRQWSDRRKAKPKMVEIDKEEFEKLCELQCTEKEIAAFFGVSTAGVGKWCRRTYWDDDGNPMNFEQVFEEKRQAGFISLRRSNWKLIKQGNVPLNIFYSKNYLGLSDNPSGTIDDGVTVNVNIVSNDDNWEDDDGWEEWGDEDDWD